MPLLCDARRAMTLHPFSFAGGLRCAYNQETQDVEADLAMESWSSGMVSTACCTGGGNNPSMMHRLLYSETVCIFFVMWSRHIYMASVPCNPQKPTCTSKEGQPHT